MNLSSPASKHTASTLLAALLETTESSILPLLRESVSAGNAPFGAVVLSRSSLALVTASTNHDLDSPLLHGETNCIREFFLLPASARPDPKDCIFFSTHEPCSMCLSGICWTAFPRVHFLFTYEDTRNLLGVGGDIEIIEEVFRVRAPGDADETLRARALYNKKNKFFEAVAVDELLEEVEDSAEKERLRLEVERVKGLFDEFHEQEKAREARRCRE